MQVFVDRRISKLPFDFERFTNELIRYVPLHHLSYLNRIEILYSESDKKGVQGLYCEKEKNSEAKIILYPQVIFYKMPKLLFYLFPPIPRILYASTLYHEIGHHYQRMIPGIKKEKWEQDAELYAKKMNKLAFHRYQLLLLLVFWPILILRKLLKPNNNKKPKQKPKDRF